jgi:hypothetical protein
VTVYGYAHQVISPARRGALTESVLEQLLDELDQEYGDPDDSQTEATARMRVAAEALVDAVCADYHVWVCDLVSQRDVEVLPWAKEHRPDWLE